MDPTNEFAKLEAVELNVPATPAAALDGACGPGPSAIGPAMGAAFGTLFGYLQRHGLQMAGPPRAIYHACGSQGVKFTAAIPIAAAPAGAAESPTGAAPDPVTIATLPAAKALRFLHRGPYPELAKTYGLVTEYMKAKGLITSEADWPRYMPMWEEYIDDPGSTPAPQLRTYIYVPLP